MATPSIILNAFNDQLAGLLDDMILVFPESIDIRTAQNSLSLIRKANPKMTIKIWKTNVVDVYGDKFDSNDIEFFLEKDYQSDISGAEHSNKIMDAINRIRSPIKSMCPSDKEKCMKYLQNLKQLCCLFHDLC